MKTVALTALFLVVGCAAKTTTTTTIVEEEEWTEETPNAPKRVSPPAQVKTGEVASPVAAAAAESDDSDSAGGVCGARPTREDCNDCCAVLAGGRSKGCANSAGCDVKAEANDCRVNACGGGTSCLKCWTGWRCVPSGQTC